MLHPAGTVLDAGCGTGLTQLLLACDEVKALDFRWPRCAPCKGSWARVTTWMVMGDPRDSALS